MCVVCFRGATEAGERKLLSCTSCQGIRYCSKACQLQNWPQHKRSCKEMVRINRSREAKGLSGREDKKTFKWLASTPRSVLAIVTYLAWKHRAESPYVQVIGGPDGKVEEVVLVTRKEWIGAGYAADHARALSAGLENSQSRSDNDKVFHLFVKTFHPGTESWPSVTSLCRFPKSPRAMDEDVRNFERSEGPDLGASSWRRVVHLKGLRTESLNGVRGVRLGYDEENDRWAVQLQSGNIAKVKRANVDVLWEMVCLKGLRTESLNGKEGVRREFDLEKMRWNVQLEGGRMLAVKRENIEALRC